ncbi:hypothetical protein GCM10009785_03150 [Brooklawnia cerclae]|uniref:Uncharacterized protein n=1 Tax=Brooklawnia cerclae TaxID=349934 RepID=A0ABX0SH70_9ACTN|nr:DUF5703 family protein [Brooklawnia cerclae]NIH56091.1 hypothetical protein [Brooklawnia cerclae]
MREPPTSYIASSRLRQEFVRGVEFEVNQITMPRWVTNRQAQKVLTEEAEYGGWELVRLRRYRDGTRDAWLRRRIIKARPTYLVAPAD